MSGRPGGGGIKPCLHRREHLTARLSNTIHSILHHRATSVSDVLFLWRQFGSVLGVKVLNSYTSDISSILLLLLIDDVPGYFGTICVLCERGLRSSIF